MCNYLEGVITKIATVDMVALIFSRREEELYLLWQFFVGFEGKRVHRIEDRILS